MSVPSYLKDIHPIGITIVIHGRMIFGSMAFIVQNLPRYAILVKNRGIPKKYTVIPDSVNVI